MIVSSGIVGNPRIANVAGAELWRDKFPECYIARLENGLFESRVANDKRVRNL